MVGSFAGSKGARTTLGARGACVKNRRACHRTPGTAEVASSLPPVEAQACRLEAGLYQRSHLDLNVAQVARGQTDGS